MSDAAAVLSAPAEAGAEGDNGAETGVSGTAPSWTEGLNLGDDTLAYVQNKGWENPGQLLESYQNLEKFQGGSKSLVEIPGVDATDEQMGSFYDALGRPGSPSEYGLELPEGGDENLMNWFSETAHRYGLSQKQTQSLYNEWNEMSASRMENMQHDMKVQAENDIASLKKEWGSEYDKMIDAGRLAANGLGYDQEALSNLESKMGTGEMLRLFATMGSKIGEPDFIDGKGNDGFNTSPAQAQAQIAELKTDKQFMDAYMNGDKAAIAKMQRLMDKSYG